MQEKSFRIPKKDILELVLLGAVGLGGTDYLVSLSFARLDVGTAVMIHFVFPALVLLASIAMFGRKFSILSAVAVAVSLFGLYCAATPSGGLPLAGLLAALGSAVTYSVFVIANDRSSIVHYPTAIRMFYMSLGSMAVISAKVFLSGNFSLPVNGKVAFVLFSAVGLLCSVGFLLIAYGTQLIGAEKAAFLSMLEPVFGAVFGVLIYREVISAKAFIGYLLIPLSIVLIAMDDVRLRRAGEAAAANQENDA